MKKIIVILCVRLCSIIPGSYGWSYYHDIWGVYISPAGKTTWPKWYKSWIYKVGEWMKEKLFNYIKKNKDIAKEYHRAVIKKKNENSKDGTVYV